MLTFINKDLHEAAFEMSNINSSGGILTNSIKNKKPVEDSRWDNAIPYINNIGTKENNIKLKKYFIDLFFNEKIGKQEGETMVFMFRKGARPTRIRDDGTLYINYIYGFEEVEAFNIYMKCKKDKYNLFTINEEDYKMRIQIIDYIKGQRPKQYREYINYESETVDYKTYFNN